MLLFVCDDITISDKAMLDILLVGHKEMRIMKLILFILTIWFFSIQAFGADRIPYADTQGGMNEAATQRLKGAEAEMKTTFDALVMKSGGKTDAIVKLRKTQTAWETYRDLQLELEVYWPFPERSWYGSVHPMCFSDVKRLLTEARTQELRKMLNPVENDVCSSQWPD